MIDELQDVVYLGAAHTIDAARPMLHSHSPAIVVLDVFLPDGSGLDLLRYFRTLPAPPRVILLTVATNEKVLYHLLERNVSAMVWKNTQAIVAMKTAIERVAVGRCYYPADVEATLKRFRQSSTSFHKILSNSEINLLSYFGRGDSDDEISSGIGLSAFTIKSHRQRIMAKLNIHTTQKLMRWIVDKGFYLPRSQSIDVSNC